MTKTRRKFTSADWGQAYLMYPYCVSLKGPRLPTSLGAIFLVHVYKDSENIEYACGGLGTQRWVYSFYSILMMVLKPVFDFD
uniref:Uncharacterized protein n=1 Tax=Anguilla anguilla TaxID=7936 RepID=A0A0E9X6N8_ANGAN